MIETVVPVALFLISTRALSREASAFTIVVPAPGFMLAAATFDNA